jgi:hypothetical protein
MSPLALSDTATQLQGPTWQRTRRCLLKGCGHWFRPTRSQCRYCSPACQQAARRWRRWRAQQKYRTSPTGRQQRQQQARRYRQRHPPPPPSHSTAEPQQPTNSTAAAGSEGKRLPKKRLEVPLHPCARPGCYVLFPLSNSWTPRRFCCVLCRRALRCVLDREARRRRRRRRGLRRPGRRSRPPPCWRQ